MSATGFAENAPPTGLAKIRTSADELNSQLTSLIKRLAEIGELTTTE